MFQFKTLKWSRHAPTGKQDDCIGLITLSRPDALNAIDVRMRVELDLILDQIKRDDTLRVVVITGEGRGFPPAATSVAKPPPWARSTTSTISATSAPTRSSPIISSTTCATS